MITTAAETREDKRGRIGKENVDSVPIDRTATAVPMAPNLYLAGERPTKKRLAQLIIKLGRKPTSAMLDVYEYKISLF